MHAAVELQRFLFDISGATFPIVTDRTPPVPHEIILGPCNRYENIGFDPAIPGLGEEGYHLATVGNALVIAGGEMRGALYGVYALLEDVLGCRWFTPEISRIPAVKRLIVPPLNTRYSPVITYREPYVWEAFDGDWAARNRMNRNSKGGGLGLRHGGRIEWVPDMFVHTFEKLVPPDEHFSRHPEYFSLVNGRRLKRRSQLCCTNEDVVKLVTEGTLEAFRRFPDALVVSVSQNDWFNFCECRKCRELAEKEGSQIAPVLQMVNRVAEAVEKEFPGKIISTLAYQWTRKPPLTIRPRDNVVIRLSSIECCFTHSFRNCDSMENRLFAEDIRAWSRVADRLWVWNYATSFAEYFVPFPNLRVRSDNIRFFAEHNVTAVFQQDVYTTPHGEFSDLSAYLSAKLLWNPWYDADKAMREFLEDVYGPAAPFIQAYLDLLHDTVERENIHAGIWQRTDAAYLTDKILFAAENLWNRAEDAASGDDALLRRVRIERLSYEYARIARERTRGDAFIVDHDRFRLTVNPEFTDRLKEFCRVADDAGVVRLREYNYTVDEFRADVEKEIADRELTPLKPARASGNGGVRWKYYTGSWKGLPNFASLRPRETGSAENISLPPADGTEIYGVVFSGRVTVPRDGVYRFFSRSDGFSSVVVGGRKIIHNGGNGHIRERSGFIALKKGVHPVTVTFYTGEGGIILDVFWSGPGFGKVPLSAAAFV